jgi:hypothetical protein
MAVRTIAGLSSGAMDGHALREAKFNGPTAVALDDTDPVAGPQLIIADGDRLIRCLNLRSEQVTTIAGNVNGPAREALFAGPTGLGVSRSGVLFVAEQVQVSHSLFVAAGRYTGRVVLTHDAAPVVCCTPACHARRTIGPSAAFRRGGRRAPLTVRALAGT